MGNRSIDRARRQALVESGLVGHRGDLQQQLFAHGGGEGLPVVGGDHEGGRPADDVAAIGLLQVVVDRPAAAVTAENGKAVDAQRSEGRRGGERWVSRFTTGWSAEKQ